MLTEGGMLQTATQMPFKNQDRLSFNASPPTQYDPFLTYLGGETSSA